MTRDDAEQKSAVTDGAPPRRFRFGSEYPERASANGAEDPRLRKWPPGGFRPVEVPVALQERWVEILRAVGAGRFG